jgi:hypothetical protein
MMNVGNDERLLDEVREHPYPLLFATVSGAHLYGFASADSDWDLRGAHVLPLSAVAGLDEGEATVKNSSRCCCATTATCWSSSTRRWWCTPRRGTAS